MARPSKLTPALRDRIVDLVRAGNYFEVAARAVGVSKATFYRWKKRGREEGKGIYFEFFRTLEQAQAECEAVCAGRVKLAGGGDWRADAWLLERRHPGRWGHRRPGGEPSTEFTSERVALGAEVLTDKPTRKAHRELLRASTRARQGKPRRPGAGN